MKADSYKRLLYWIKERELIRRKKEVGQPPPWTTDPILAAYRFCNVRREDDRVTIWIRENIREPFADHPQLWFMLCIARQINLPATLEALIKFGGWPDTRKWNAPRARQIMQKMQADGKQVYTGAYMVRGPTEAGMSKPEWTIDHVMLPLWERHNEAEDFVTLEQMHGWLINFNGWGPFMAYQAVVDMRFTAILDTATDRGTWAAAGPGTLRGLNRLQGREVKQPLSQEQALEELRALRARLLKDCPTPMDFSDVPNICCEFDKHERVRLGEGRPRSLYKPQGS